MGSVKPTIPGPAGRRAKWAYAILGIVLAAALGSQAGKLEQVQKSDLAEFLPGDAESVAALEASRRFPSGQTAPAVIVAFRPGGLTDRDHGFLARLGSPSTGDELAAPLRGQPSPVRSSPDGEAATVEIPFAASNSDAVASSVETLRERADSSPEGLRVDVTGPAGFSTDLKNVFTGADTRLLLVTGGLVLFLLILIYRSPIFWLIPFFTVLLAEGASRGMAAVLGEVGLTINGQNAGILSVLVFGAATDYALLLVARYREELGRRADIHHAMSVALRGAIPAILASSGTVIAGLLTLLIADVDSTRSIGPLGAAGIALCLSLSLSVLPATLLIAGRRAFWPFVPRVESEQPDGQKGAGALPGRRVWQALGSRISARPRPFWIGSVIALVVLASGVIGADTSLTQEQQLRADPESVKGQELLTRHFPPGLSAPATVIVPNGEDATEVTRALKARPQLVAAVLGSEAGAPGTKISVVLASDPFAETAVDSIPDIRDEISSVAAGALLGGQTAQSYDLREAAQRDNLVVPPLTLLVVVLILIALLRSLVAPVLLLAATVLSAGAALGAGIVIFDLILGLPALDPTLPLLAFVFLVALGIDYTIFLMARTREEAAHAGTRDGVIRALVTTGGVITSAGVVLAGTFSALAVLPLTVLTQLGVVVALGVLLDTLLVRSVLVPALISDIGGGVWWPRRDVGD